MELIKDSKTSIIEWKNSTGQLKMIFEETHNSFNYVFERIDAGGNKFDELFNKKIKKICESGEL